MSASPDVLWAAWTGVGVWAVAVPLAHLALLQLGMRKDDALVGDYRPDRQWWEVVVVLEKLALTGFLALYNPGEWQQLFVATVIALFCFVLQMLVRPYRRESDNTFALLTSLSLVPLFLGSLALQVDATAGSMTAVGGSKLELPSLGFVILVLIALAALFVWEHSQAREVLVLQSAGSPELRRRRPLAHLPQPQLGQPGHGRHHQAAAPATARRARLSRRRRPPEYRCARDVRERQRRNAHPA